MKKFLSSLLLSLTVLITASPVYADGESISSVTVVGATEQSGTPTPTNPVNIVTNNGVVKVAINIHNVSTDTLGGYLNPASDELVSAASYGHTNYIPVVTGQTYQIGRRGVNTTDANAILQYNENKVFQTSQAIDALGGTYTVPNGVSYIRCNFNKTYQQFTLKRNSTFYTEGAGETIADSANHTATVETLFAVGDYADEQNINTGVITRKVGVKVLDGTEYWTAMNGTGKRFRGPAITNALNAEIACSHYGYDDESNDGDTIRLNASKEIVINGDNTYASSTEFSNWLATQYANGTPVIIVYPLATETTENVTAQTMTTAPVIQNNGTIATTIRTLLQNGQTLLSNSLKLGIKIATTAYNNNAFSSVQTALNSAVDTIKTVVANTILQTAAVQQIASNKQNRPSSGCPAGKTCLLVEDMNGEPHWYEIIENIYGLPSGYTALEYIESTGTQYIDTGVIVQTPQTLTGSTIDFMVTSVDTAVANSACVAGAIIAGSSEGAYKNTQIIVYQNQLNDGLGFTFSQSDWHQRIVATCDGAGPASPNMSFLLFGRNRTNNMGPQLLGGVRIYSAKIYENGTLVRDFIPVKYVSGNTTTYGMYDTVTNTFYTNAGSGTFTAGPVAQ